MKPRILAIGAVSLLALNALVFAAGESPSLSAERLLETAGVPGGTRAFAHPLFVAAVGSWPLLFGMGLMMLGNGLQGSLLGLRATQEGFATAVTGLIMSGYFLGFLAGSTLTPPLVARVGQIRVFAALASLASVAIVVHGPCSASLHAMSSTTAYVLPTRTSLIRWY